MIERLARNLVSWQIRKDMMPEDKESLYTYAYELLIGQAVNLLIACLLAVVFRDYITVLVYLASYIPLRSYAGGHHANTFKTCTVVSAGFICIACLMVKVIPTADIWIADLAGGLISGSTVFLLAPVEDHNKPLDETEKIRYRRLSKEIWLAETVLWILCYLAGAGEMSLAIILSHFTLSGMLCAGSLKNKRLSKVLK